MYAKDWLLWQYNSQITITNLKWNKNTISFFLITSRIVETTSFASSEAAV